MMTMRVGLTRGLTSDDTRWRTPAETTVVTSLGSRTRKAPTSPLYSGDRPTKRRKVIAKEVITRESGALQSDIVVAIQESDGFTWFRPSKHSANGKAKRRRQPHAHESASSSMPSTTVEDSVFSDSATVCMSDATIADATHSDKPSANSHTTESKAEKSDARKPTKKLISTAAKSKLTLLRSKLSAAGGNAMDGKPLADSSSAVALNSGKQEASDSASKSASHSSRIGVYVPSKSSSSPRPPSSASPLHGTGVGMSLTHDSKAEASGSSEDTQVRVADAKTSQRLLSEAPAAIAIMGKKTAIAKKKHRRKKTRVETRYRKVKEMVPTKERRRVLRKKPKKEKKKRKKKKKKKRSKKKEAADASDANASESVAAAPRIEAPVVRHFEPIAPPMYPPIRMSSARDSFVGSSIVDSLQKFENAILADCSNSIPQVFGELDSESRFVFLTDALYTATRCFAENVPGLCQLFGSSALSRAVVVSKTTGLLERPIALTLSVSPQPMATLSLDAAATSHGSGEQLMADVSATVKESSDSSVAVANQRPVVSQMGDSSSTVAGDATKEKEEEVVAQSEMKRIAADVAYTERQIALVSEYNAKLQTEVEYRRKLAQVLGSGEFVGQRLEHVRLGIVAANEVADDAQAEGALDGLAQQLSVFESGLASRIEHLMEEMDATNKQLWSRWFDTCQEHSRQQQQLDEIEDTMKAKMTAVSGCAEIYAEDSTKVIADFMAAENRLQEFESSSTMSRAIF